MSTIKAPGSKKSLVLNSTDLSSSPPVKAALIRAGRETVALSVSMPASRLMIVILSISVGALFEITLLAKSIARMGLLNLPWLISACNSLPLKISLCPTKPTFPNCQNIESVRYFFQSASNFEYGSREGRINLSAPIEEPALSVKFKLE